MKVTSKDCILSKSATVNSSGYKKCEHAPKLTNVTTHKRAATPRPGETRFTCIKPLEKFTDSSYRVRVQQKRRTSSPATNSIKAESHACCVTFLLPTTNRTNYSPDHVPAPTRQRPTLMEQIIWIIAQKASTVSTLSGLGFHNFSSSRGPWKSIGGASKSGKRISAPEDWTPLSVSCSFGGGGAGRLSAVECYCSGRWQLTVQWDDRRIGDG